MLLERSIGRKGPWSRKKGFFPLLRASVNEVHAWDGMAEKATRLTNPSSRNANARKLHYCRLPNTCKLNHRRDRIS
jgi:hypothetical protein